MRIDRKLVVILVSVALIPGTAFARQTFWAFDNLSRIGGIKAHVEGTPHLIRTLAGRAVAFNGSQDALFLPRHPLAGAKRLTVEAIFRPDGGAFEQRWFHLNDGAEGSPSPTRTMFEIRVVDGGQWYLDAFTTGPANRR